MKKKSTFLTLFLCLSFFYNVYAQIVIDESQLELNNGKYLLNNTEYNGLVYSKYKTKGQYEYCYMMKNGVANGIYQTLIIDFNLDPTKFRDSSIIKLAYKEIESKKNNNEKISNDTIKATIDINEYLINIGGNKKLDKLKTKYKEGKLKGESLNLFEKYLANISIIQKGKQSIQDNLNVIDAKQKSVLNESNKPIIKQAVSEEYYQNNLVKNGQYISFYSNNSIKSKGEYVNNLQNGLWTYYFENGKIKGQGNFKNGNGEDISKSSGIPRNGREGNWKFYYESGKLEQETNYLDGLVNGKSVMFYENGNLSAVEQFVNGKLNGKRQSYFENGKLKEESQFVNGQLSGKHLLYFENGKLMQEGNMLNGKFSGIVTIYDESGQIKMKQSMLNGKGNGLKTDYYPNGKKKSDVYFVNDKPHGRAITYYDNGKIEVEGFIDTLSKHHTGESGLHIEYDQAGVMTKKVQIDRDGNETFIFPKQLGFEESQEQLRNSNHVCNWCGRTFKGLGFEAYDGSLGIQQNCRTSAKLIVILPALEKYFCSAKCAYEECIH